MAYTAPSITDFKTYFTRDFPYGSGMTTVMDADITRALSDAGVFIASSLASTQAVYTVHYLLLAAHFLVMNLRASSQGIAGQYSWLQNSKSAGSVSGGFTIPDRILANPEYAMLSKTNYGAKYLFMVLPQLSGQIFTVCGGTQP